MRSDTWLGKFWTRLRMGVVQDVPPSLDECQSCHEIECSQERWLACENRLATETARLSEGPSSGRSEELPGVSTTHESPAAPAENAESADDDSYVRRRKLSSH